MPKLPTTWKEVLELPHKHKGKDGVPSCSQLDRILSCNGSFFLEDEFKDSEASIKGTALHWCLEMNWVPDDIPEEELWVYNRSRQILEQVQFDTGFGCKYQVEPYYDKLSKIKNIILTPHIGSYSIETRIKMERDVLNLINKNLF